MLNTIKVMSREKLEEQNFQPENKIIISITDPSTQPVKIKNVPEHNILRLQFYDIDKELVDVDGTVLYYPMSKYQADKVAQFVSIFEDSCNLLIVSCEAGVSRSAGVAAAISKYYFSDDTEYFNGFRYIPNRNCYRLVLESLHELNDER